jgi:hypothetical protein
MERLVEPGTPLPTPWNKEAFDKFGLCDSKNPRQYPGGSTPESVMEDLFMKQKAGEDAYFAKETYRDKVGAFEGAGYTPKGLYRPPDRLHHVHPPHGICKVCRRSLSDVFDQYVK